jgi:hypothetical protein
MLSAGSGDVGSRHSARLTFSKIKTFGKIPCPCSIKGLRFLHLATETHPQNRRFGYARVSTVGQTLDSQLSSCAPQAAPPKFTARR